MSVPSSDSTSPVRRPALALLCVRVLFVLILAGTAAKIASELGIARTTGRTEYPWFVPPLTFLAVMTCGAIALVADILSPRKSISGISAIFFGLMVGSILGYFLRLAVNPTLQMMFDEEMISWLSVVITATLCYLCVSVLLQTKNDFRFVIPYVEFQPQLKGARPLVLDSSVIIDGRIADIADSGLIDQAIVIPSFVLDEVQAIADSHDRLRRKRGLRGLETIDRLRGMTALDVDIRGDDEAEGIDRKDVSSRLIALAKSVNGRLVSNDVTLAKAAKIQGVDSISINAVTNAVKPPVLWGDRICVEIVKEGEEAGQGVGYMDDGTMVVVEMGKRFIGHEVNLIVESFLQTSGGRMIFGRIDSKNPSPSQAINS